MSYLLDTTLPCVRQWFWCCFTKLGMKGVEDNHSRPITEVDHNQA